MDDNDFLHSIQEDVQRSLLAKEQLYNAIRQSGVEAPAKILSVMDTGVRIGDNASMLRFDLEVYPAQGTPCGGTQTIEEGQVACAFCGKGLPGR